MKTKIIIAGGGTAGWVTAAVLCKGLPSDTYQITLIDAQEIAPIGVGEASIPPIVQFLEYLQLDAREFIQNTSGSFKFGIDFVNWGTHGRRYMHAFGPVGTNFGEIKFSDLWLAFAEPLGFKNLIPFSTSAVAAYKGKFGAASLQQGAGFKPLNQLFSAFHFDAGALANYLSKYAVSLGCDWQRQKIVQVNQQNKQITALTLQSGETLTADYFVDCSGQSGIFNKQALQGQFADWSEWLPCDSAWVVPTAPLNPLPPYTQSIAMSAGWRWQIPLQNRTGNGYVFSRSYIDEDAARDELAQALNLDAHSQNNMRCIHFKTGHLTQAWQGNSIAIGLAAGFAEPLESTSIHLIYKYAIELKNALIYGKNMALEAARFSRSFNHDMLDIRDFLIAHYHVNEYKNSAFWSARQQMSVPESVSNNLQQFKKDGRLTIRQGALFSYDSWFQVLIGQGLLAAQQNQVSIPNLAYLPDITQVDSFFKSVYQTIHQQTDTLAAHQAVLRTFSPV